LEKDLFDSLKDAQNAKKGTILGLAKLAEYRDKDTGSHLERIREYARVITEELSTNTEYKGYISRRYIDDIYLSSILHDIGKVGIPDSILLKKGKLTGSEYDVMKRHPIYGGDALSAVESQVAGESFIALGKIIAYTGYPLSASCSLATGAINNGSKSRCLCFNRLLHETVEKQASRF
jgi:response regulator RpfG family c-di-GMP phosphodiesterase